MFQGDKYVSKGIDEKLSPILILLLWDMIEEARSQTELDYLQIFDLSPAVKNGMTVQKVIHWQESPKYKHCIYVICDKPITDKIYCIDDNNTHSTMILAEEY